MSSIIALIPARSGSKRIPNKNIKRLGKHPLIAYTIEQAKQSGIFDEIMVSSDSDDILLIAQYYGAECFGRSEEYAREDSPDIGWIREMLPVINGYDYFAILRPTNPFRTPEMIKKAWAGYIEGEWMKGIERVSQHPYKMWRLYSAIMSPILGMGNADHAKQSNTLPIYYVQNGSIEIRPTKDLEPQFVQPFITEGYTGIDINSEADWVYAEWLIANNKVNLIDIDKEPYAPSV